MKTLDRLLQRWRIAKVKPYIPKGANVLDIGCADGALFKQFESHVSGGIGIDPCLQYSEHIGSFRLIAGKFPDDLPDTRLFNVITMLAVLEHVKSEDQPSLAKHCAQLLAPEGYLIITVPSRIVDWILHVLKFLRVIDGMSLEQHYGFDVSTTPLLFSVDGLRLVKAEKFQLGLNNLFVFRKSQTKQSDDSTRANNRSGR